MSSTLRNLVHLATHTHIFRSRSGSNNSSNGGSGGSRTKENEEEEDDQTNKNKTQKTLALKIHIKNQISSAHIFFSFFAIFIDNKKILIYVIFVVPFLVRFAFLSFVCFILSFVKLHRFFLSLSFSFVSSLFDSSKFCSLFFTTFLSSLSFSLCRFQ